VCRKCAAKRAGLAATLFLNGTIPAKTAGFRLVWLDSSRCGNNDSASRYAVDSFCNFLNFLQGVLRLSVGVDRMQRSFEPMRKQVEAWRTSQLSDAAAKLIIYHAFIAGELEVPKHLARLVHHYDHLDLPTLRQLAARGNSTFVVPARVARLLRSEKIEPVHELDWGESCSLPNFTVHSVPALHFSTRGIYDRNKALWCGYVIESRDCLIYFAGDTAFGPHFAQTPRWFMSPVHMGPDEAVRAHQILGAKTSVAIHHGTFQLADAGLDTPKKQLASLTPGDSFLVLNNGQFADLP